MNEENTVNSALEAMKIHTLERKIAKNNELQDALNLLKNLEDRQKTLLDRQKTLSFTLRILIVILSLSIFYNLAAFIRGIWNL